jgi:hypothetical protein
VYGIHHVDVYVICHGRHQYWSESKFCNSLVNRLVDRFYRFLASVFFSAAITAKNNVFVKNLGSDFLQYAGVWPGESGSI